MVLCAVQILFVDRTDTVRARVAAGLLERIAEWNGYGRALYPYACGVEAQQVCLFPFWPFKAIAVADIV